MCSGSGDIDLEITEGQQKVINSAAEIAANTWFSINNWSKENYGKLSPKEQAFIGQVGFLIKRGNTLTYKQSKYAFDIMEKAENAGWKEE